LPTKLAILGGSSPFTASLVDALKSAHPAVPPQTLTLYGRNSTSLELVGRYAEAQLGTLGWSVQTTTRCAEALDAAHWVIHQIRYGGMSGRSADEQLAEAHGVPIDETLGPAGLAAALRTIPVLEQLIALIERYCPDAWVLNLTNPLSMTTAVLSRYGVRRCVGLCELPWYTLREACRLLGLPPREVQWSYSGLNHRGFIHELSYKERDYMAALPDLIGQETLVGIRACEIAELGAIPLKYFQLLIRRATAAPRRAEYLRGLGERLLAELQASVSRSPPSLTERYLEWYPGAVVPMLASLATGRGDAEVVNIWRDADITWEVRARIFGDRYEVLPAPQPGHAVQSWLEAFVVHEKAALAAAMDPTRERIDEALAADPVVPENRVRALSNALMKMRSPRCVLA
jgi:6-phospho-beta-glucosidase